MKLELLERKNRLHRRVLREKREIEEARKKAHFSAKTFQERSAKLERMITVLFNQSLGGEEREEGEEGGREGWGRRGGGEEKRGERSGLCACFFYCDDSQ